MKILNDHVCGDVIARYLTDEAGRVGLMLVPRSRLADVVERRKTLSDELFIQNMPPAPPPPAIVVDSLAQVKLVGDPYSGAFAQGRTMHGSESVSRFALVEQRKDAGAIITVLGSEDGLRIEHRLQPHAGALRIETSFSNGSKRPVTLEMLSSFCLSGITPFHQADAPERLQVHRFRSVWSAEGRLETRTIEQLHLERSWSGAGKFSERFGTLGTMPVRGWFPFVSVEDVAAKVVWAAQLAWAGSWQMEIVRQHDDLSISGGLADREFGHWTRTLAPGESLASPSATVICVAGSLDDACDRLTEAQQAAVDLQPAGEADLPIVFNEWCTTWGDPKHDRLVGIADRLRNLPVRYLVIDAGWYKPDGGDWSTAHGDWRPNRNLFPSGLKTTAEAIRARGLIPGLWFEMETVGDQSAAFSLGDHLLKRDGIPITVRNRRFWDLNDSAAIDYLSRRVIEQLRDCGFGYLKVDYNETAGLGCDGAESQGEGLRRQIEGVYRFFERIRSELPDLVIENCSSGGHRLEPSMLARTAMSSFSDAHELIEIPIVAANLHRLILPRQSQIWAVLHASDSNQRLLYSLAATFLGRMCLSGDIDRLSDEQMQIVSTAADLYRQAAPIIKHGQSRLHRQMGESWRRPRGWQAVVRARGDQAMVVIHTFVGSPRSLSVTLPSGEWTLDRSLTSSPPALNGRELCWTNPTDDTGAVILCTRRR